MNQNNVNIKRKILFDAGGGNKPVVRAMIANVYLFSGAGFFIIEIFLRIAHSTNFIIDIIVISIGVFFIREYIISVARIVISESSLAIILSLHEVILKREIIKSLELSRLHISNIIKIKICGREKRKKWIFHLYWYKKDEYIEILRSSWLNEICTIDGKPLTPDGGFH